MSGKPSNKTVATRAKRRVPWWTKIGAKMVLSRLPLGYRLWARLGMFVHGNMTRPEYAYAIFAKHHRLMTKRATFTCLELGPGDSLFTAMIAPAFGGTKTYLVDTGNYASRDPRLYAAMGDLLCEKTGSAAPRFTSLYEMLSRNSATYLTEGLASLRGIPDKSVDLILSNAVLEHVRKKEFPSMIREFRRILRDDGVCSHQVDLQDHLDQALNNLRFSERAWESAFFTRSGFYTNRIRFEEMLTILRSAGFTVEVSEIARWESVPTPRHKLAPEFAALDDDDLRVKSFFVVLRPI